LFLLSLNTSLPPDLFTGAVYQESASLITVTGDKTSYEGAGYSTFGSSVPSLLLLFLLTFFSAAFEYSSGPDGSITWFVNDEPTWTLEAAALGPDDSVNGTQVSQRLLSVEPMSININLAISNAFRTFSLSLSSLSVADDSLPSVETPNWSALTFPGTFRVE
jgi:energy-coupling factor transporter transmembrane protein EcfT